MDERIARIAYIRTARAAGVDLSLSDFVWDDSVGWTLDGMDPGEWLDAMTGE